MYETSDSDFHMITKKMRVCLWQTKDNVTQWRCRMATIRLLGTSEMYCINWLTFHLDPNSGDVGGPELVCFNIQFVPQNVVLSRI